MSPNNWFQEHLFKIYFAWTELINKIYSFINDYPKKKYISNNLKNNVKDISIEKDVNKLFTYLIPLLNDGRYHRFNSCDYYSKSSNIKEVCNILNKYSSHYLGKKEYSVVYIVFISHLNSIAKAFPNLKNAIAKIEKDILHCNLNARQTFVKVRNIICEEWIDRNFFERGELRFKDLDYLGYSVEEYHNYLHNCLNLLIRDVDRFQKRYPKENPDDLDVDLMIALNNTVYKNIEVKQIPGIDIISLAIALNQKDETQIHKPVILRGWRKEKPKTEYINFIQYKNYRRS